MNEFGKMRRRSKRNDFFFNVSFILFFCFFSLLFECCHQSTIYWCQKMFFIHTFFAFRSCFSFSTISNVMKSKKPIDIRMKIVLVQLFFLFSSRFLFRFLSTFPFCLLFSAINPEIKLPLFKLFFFFAFYLRSSSFHSLNNTISFTRFIKNIETNEKEELSQFNYVKPIGLFSWFLFIQHYSSNQL